MSLESGREHDSQRPVQEAGRVGDMNCEPGFLLQLVLILIAIITFFKIFMQTFTKIIRGLKLFPSVLHFSYYTIKIFFMMHHLNGISTLPISF